MPKFFFIAAGGALGAAARYGVSGWVQNVRPATFPWGTLCVNTIGSFLMGAFLGARLTASRFHSYSSRNLEVWNKYCPIAERLRALGNEWRLG